MIPRAWIYEDQDPAVQVVVDGESPFTYSAQYTGRSGTGERTIDTFLDQVVRGAPIAAFDLWQKERIHESSRRRNDTCGIDVIVASSTVRTAHNNDKGRPRFTSEEAAQRLMLLAKEHFPDSALAQCDAWAQPASTIRETRAANVTAELNSRNITLVELRPYIPKWKNF